MQDVPNQDRVREILCKVYLPERPIGQAGGDVQGVSFRNFAREKAKELGIAGTAQNLDDGTVEVVAQGKESVLRTFLDYLYMGPEDAAVESVNVQWGPVTEVMNNFVIL